MLNIPPNRGMLQDWDLLGNMILGSGLSRFCSLSITAHIWVIVIHIINKNRLKGSPNTILAACKALSACDPPATSKAQATAKKFANARPVEQ